MRFYRENNTASMALDVTRSLEIIEMMENYISIIRPPQEIRPKLDIDYEIKNKASS